MEQIENISCYCMSSLALNFNWNFFSTPSNLSSSVLRGWFLIKKEKEEKKKGRKLTRLILVL